jgi:general secretion pathway protein J
MSRHKQQGFTLLEVLIAVFIFTLVAIIMTHALSIVFHSDAATETRTNRLAELQMATLLFSRDTEQIINRPTVDAKGATRNSLEGYTTRVTFTHGGLANPNGVMNRSTLQKTSYSFEGGALYRQVWPVLDAVQTTLPKKRKLLSGVTELHFDYLDYRGLFHNTWPPAEQTKQMSFPRALRITMTLEHWGKLSLLYAIPATIGTGANE